MHKNQFTITWKTLTLVNLATGIFQDLANHFKLDHVNAISCNPQLMVILVIKSTLILL